MSDIYIYMSVCMYCMYEVLIAGARFLCYAYFLIAVFIALILLSVGLLIGERKVGIYLMTVILHIIFEFTYTINDVIHSQCPVI